MPEVLRRTSLSKTTLYNRINAGNFPRQLKLSGGMIAWYESDIDAWIADPVGWRAPSELSGDSESENDPT